MHTVGCNAIYFIFSILDFAVVIFLVIFRKFFFLVFCEVCVYWQHIYLDA